MQYICTGNKLNDSTPFVRTIKATSARDAFLAFTKDGYVENVSIILITEEIK